VQPHDLVTADGADGGTARAAAVLLHPHPDMGGDRFNNVVAELFRILPSAGITTIRFDFSSSDIDTAAGETLEALTALPADGAPRFLVGYSFGGGVAATIDDDRVAGWFLAAPALTLVHPAIGADPRPKLIAAAEHDRFFAPDQLEAATKDWTATTITTIPGADHFFVGRADVVAQRCTEWITQVTPVEQ
jgi:alpha/beta superfamily hydrolase